MIIEVTEFQIEGIKHEEFMKIPYSERVAMEPKDKERAFNRIEESLLVDQELCICPCCGGSVVSNKKEDDREKAFICADCDTTFGLN
jgi:hypothetical protein